MDSKQILDAIGDMTIRELVDLTKSFAERFNIKAASPATPMPPVDQPAEKTEQTEFTVVLLDIGPKKIAVIKEVRGLMKLGLKEAKAFVEGELPLQVATEVDSETALAIVATFNEAGATTRVF